jgi:hypothetical protein
MITSLISLVSIVLLATVALIAIRNETRYKAALDEIGLAVYIANMDPHWENEQEITEVARRLAHSNEQGNPLVARYERELWMLS